MKKLLVISSLPPAAFACCRRYPPDGWPLSNPVYRQSGPALLDAQATLGEQEHSTHSRHLRMASGWREERHSLSIRQISRAIIYY